MKRKCPKLILFFVFIFSNSNLIAQNDGISDILYYLDDGISGKNNIIKQNALAIINGDLAVFYERILGKAIGVEIGVGLLLPYYIYELGSIFDEKFKENTDLGYSLWIFPKYYVTSKAPERGYLGIQFRKRDFGQITSFTDITFNVGYQFIIGKRMTFESNIGMGIRYSKDKIKEIEDGFIIPLAIKIGYLF